MVSATRRSAARVIAAAALLLVVMGSGVVAGVSSTAGPAGAASATIVVGSQTLTKCSPAPVAYCGTLMVPLDSADPGVNMIPIAYRWYPATFHSATPNGTLFPVEGGPGYPSIESVRGYDAVMYGSLTQRWNMLAVDLRGTGRSNALNCPALQNFAGQASGKPYEDAVAGCVTALNHHWKTPSGAWVQASDLFTSARAAADVVLVMQALAVPKIDLYGDSYGSFFAQVFANHYPNLIRSVILDSTYETQGLDPWYRSSIDDMPADFDHACTRSPACAAAETEPAWTRIEQLAKSLKKAPATGTVPVASGALAPVTMTAVGLIDLINDAAGDPEIYRGIDAAARADLLDHDPGPLLRLYAQRLKFDENYFNTPAPSYSDELYLAVSCLDYPQLFSLSSSNAQRVAELKSARLALAPGTFAPFSANQWLEQNQNTEAYTACLSWPDPVDAIPPTTGSTPLLPPTVPVLVLGGEFDTWTPPSDVPKVLAELGGHSRFIELANSTHVVGEGDTECGSELVEAFVAAPQDLDSLDASCAPLVPPIDSVGAYPESVSGAAPLTPGSGNAVPTAGLQLAAAAVETAGDARARHDAINVADDSGLHGGTAVAKGNTITLTDDQLIPGVAVSGTVTSGKTVVATLAVTGPGSTRATLVAQWPIGTSVPVATVTGTVDGASLAGSMQAP